MQNIASNNQSPAWNQPSMPAPQSAGQHQQFGHVAVAPDGNPLLLNLGHNSLQPDNNPIRKPCSAHKVSPLDNFFVLENTPFTAGDLHSALRKLLGNCEKKSYQQCSNSKVDCYEVARSGQLLAVKIPDFPRPVLLSRYTVHKGEINGLLARNKPYMVWTLALVVKDTGSGKYSVFHKIESIKKACTSRSYILEATIHPWLYGCTLSRVMSGRVSNHQEYTNLRCLTHAQNELPIHTAKVVAKAILFLHNQDVIHRDIKAENVFLDKYLKIRLGDFGSSVNLSGNVSIQGSCGTIPNMAPEVIQGLPYGKPADAWGIGVLLVESCCRRTPAELLHNDPPQLSEVEHRQGILRFAALPDDAKTVLLREHFRVRGKHCERLIQLITGLTRRNPNQRETVGKAYEILSQMLQDRTINSLYWLARENEGLDKMYSPGNNIVSRTASTVSDERPATYHNYPDGVYV